ncbi:DUF4142 domain-containing protein [Dyella monticola]|nr:DUF4142 domain-containing protein [Dyella monticola]
MPPIHRSSIHTTLVLLVFTLMMAPFVWAQNGTATADTPATGASGAHTAQDARFVMVASAAGQTEILASRLAATRSQSSKIKGFAATMIRDHTKANDQLKSIAQKDGYTLATTPTQTQEAAIAKLQSLQGKDFDTAYASMMLSDHHAAVALFQSESTSGNDADLKGFASSTLPTLQHHLALANAL